ncbi:MAG TPA: hypothetical protein VFN87_06595 [Solirubrobacteraceae bacterium]|nr:hypothetical protein [Solirubrobacteraceae bacterium]
MTRLPVATFVVLGAATVGAFFLSQHLKVTTPLITGYPAPVPGTINPVNGGTCLLRNPKGVKVPVSYKRTQVSFYLLNRPDVVDVTIVSRDGRVIRTLPGSGRYMALKKRRLFVWNGREDDGSIAPDGAYDIRVSLVRQNRSLLISNQNTGAVEPVTVQTRPPALVVTGVSPRVVTAPGHATVAINFTGNQGLRPRVLILRISASGAARLVKSYAATKVSGTSLWNGTLTGGRAAPPGRYLIGLLLAHDRTCNRVQSPLTATAAPQAVVTVR